MSNYALVTGGSRGIGKAVCIRLAKEGYNILINYRSDMEAAQQTAESVRQLGVSAELLQFDVGDSKMVAENLGNWSKANPEKFIEVLVNNAGVRKDQLLIFMKELDWINTINTNLNSFFYVTKPLAKKMLMKKRGCIVNISSVSGIRGVKGQSNYSASKSGLIGATRSLALELGAKNVRVNAVVPGFIKTDMTKELDEQELKNKVSLNRLGTPEEVANLVNFLISDQASYINGQVVTIDGGL